MRKCAWLRTAYPWGEGNCIHKIMLCGTEDGFLLFGYFSPEAVISSFDIRYDSLEDLYEEWNGRIDEKGWIEMEDPLPFCQQDGWVPVRVRGRETGKPQWGTYEILKDGKWTEYKNVRCFQPVR